MTARTPAAEPRNQPARAARRMSPALIAGLAALIAFAVGAGWQYVGARQARAGLADAGQALALSRLDATLAGAVIAVQSGDFEGGRRRASDFFTGLQRQLLSDPGQAKAQELRRVLGQRDATITALSRSDPASTGILQRLLGDYQSVLASGGSGVTPAAAKAPAAR